MNGRRKTTAPPEAIYHLGNGANVVYVVPVNDRVLVVRWIDSNRLNDCITAVLQALPGKK